MAVLVSFEDKKQAIAEWIESLSGVPLANIRGADETGKFKYPAVVLAEISEIDTHRPFRRVEEIDGVLQFVVYASRQVMVDINFITRSRGDHTKPPAERIPDAGNYMAQFHSGLYLPEKSIEFLSKNDLSLLSVASPLRTDEQKRDGWQKRRVIEIGFGYISQITEPISTIESIQNIKGTTYVLNDAIELEINLGPYQPTEEKGQPGGYAALDLNGEVPVDQLPDRVKVRVFTVASEIEQLAFTVHEGYICVRTDESKSYAALNDVNDSMTDWRELNAAPDASVITEDALHRFVTDAEKVTWNGKQDALGFTPEDSADKGVADGYASLDSDGKVPESQLPPIVGLPDDVFVLKPAGASSLLVGDKNKWLEFQNWISDADLTISSSATLGWPVGSIFYASKTGTGEVSFIRSGVTFLSPLGNADFKLDSDGTDGHILLFIYRGSDTFYVQGPIKPI